MAALRYFVARICFLGKNIEMHFCNRLHLRQLRAAIRQTKLTQVSDYLQCRWFNGEQLTSRHQGPSPAPAGVAVPLGVAMRLEDSPDLIASPASIRPPQCQDAHVVRPTGTRSGQSPTPSTIHQLKTSQPMRSLRSMRFNNPPPHSCSLLSVPPTIRNPPMPPLRGYW